MAEREFRIVVAGAGVSGLFMAETLKRAGIDFTVYEKAGEVGGTWRDNIFPGLFVDVLSRQYEFPFQPNYDWSRNLRPLRRSGPISRRSLSTAALPNSSGSAKRSRRRGSPAVAGASRPPKATPMSRTCLFAPPAFCISRSIPIF